jgi:formylglycine-generating enzyme required for sulfatase activity
VSGEPDPAKWNYSPSVGSEPWGVGSGTEELNGTFDMMGNVFEWVENPYYTGDYLPGSGRAIRGGSYGSSSTDYIKLRCRHNGYPSNEFASMGFRVASVPEPCTILLLSIGGLALRGKRRM